MIQLPSCFLVLHVRHFYTFIPFVPNKVCNAVLHSIILIKQKLEKKNLHLFGYPLEFWLLRGEATTALLSSTMIFIFFCSYLLISILHLCKLCPYLYLPRFTLFIFLRISPEWEVSEWALRAVPSKRLCSLAQPRAPVAGWQPDHLLPAPVSNAHNFLKNCCECKRLLLWSGANCVIHLESL